MVETDSPNAEDSPDELRKALYGAIFVEHNFTENRENIHSLLTTNGYKRVFSTFFKWDDWYLNQKLYDSLESKFGDKELS